MRLVDFKHIEKLKREAQDSPRLRSHYLLHESHSASVQRLLIALVRGSFVEPHYHAMPHQWEMFTVLQGTLKVNIYSEEGDVISQFYLGSNSLLPQVIEFSPNEIHSVQCVSEFALLLEVKEGPFDPKHAKSIPAWL